MNIVIGTAVVVLWLGCLALLLCSKHQRLLKKPLSKEASTLGFVTSFMLSIWLLMAEYNLVAASLMVLVFTLAIWLSQVLLLGHVKLKLAPFSCVNLAFWLAVAQLGGQHVV
ncbi:hypothetical protein [Shewanella woodyi]|uniref:Uncharacterized protein n=1 Tax=Shewanella woodyi (strain ATCC 51908 / MS32) TaxID=392500 RepID=B1KKF3_SHEWM|nr:hypothetical protein [Shewanella woodyi]ACA85793.1 hypothetical protein Swoo_1505 [Shewanella woodyi ATCC 51908]